ncbi:MAG: sulfate reduction electron transfer complex DsrMKJOP subunit DsrJ [Deltaproteobacteria bacterium]|nr:sulfate reduction electron transfer complex DsrMKJOP subunit DsrJ [Deltaproteobacteria bacterium]
MQDAGKIAIGIMIFLGLMLSPWLFRLANPAPLPKLEVGTLEKQCIESTPYMRAYHMIMLNTWRDAVLREGKRVYVSSTGKRWDMSLQNTCTKCHAKKTEFCDRCHNTLDAAPNCWDCHIPPKEKQIQAARSEK